MIGTTLVGIREHIEALADPTGSYYVVCGRTGERPVPASGLRFQSRDRAREAARATGQYRDALRRYDPRTPHYDLIVVEESDADLDSGARPVGTGTEARTLSDTVLDGATPLDRHRIEFCHRVTAAVFEALSEGAYEAVETAVMDRYVELAESVEDPDQLCLCLLGTLATALDDRLPPTEQAAVLSAAADHLPSAPHSDRPVTAALTVLERRGLLGEFECAPAGMDREARSRSVVVTLGEYALAPQSGRLPVLPVAVELYRQRVQWAPAALRVAEATEGWQLTVELGTAADPASLSTAPIQQ
jgi:hypothetical protein